MRTFSHSGLGSRFFSWTRAPMKAAGITEAAAERERSRAGAVQHRAQHRQRDALRYVHAQRGLEVRDHLLGEARLLRGERALLLASGSARDGQLAADREDKCRNSCKKSATPGASFHRAPPRTRHEHA